MYEVVISDKAERQLKKLEKGLQERIISSLERARIRPEAHFKKLVGEEAYSLRVGHYRVIADIIKNKLIILVLKVGHRKNVYKK
jgi:mRNA interferase RelE/StbE